MIPQNARLHAGGDLRRTAGLGTIADNTRNDGQCIDKGVGDRFQVCALQIGNAAARSTARADGPAVGGQPPYTGLLVDRNQVGEGQCAAESLIGCPQLSGILDDRHRDRDALIAAARVDDNWQLTAAHTGIRACCCLGNSAVAHILAVKFQHCRADVRTVIPSQSLLRDAGVVPDLGFQQRSDVVDLAGIGKCKDIRNVQQCPVCQTALGRGGVTAELLCLLRGMIQQHFAVSLDQDNIRVVLADAHHGGIAPLLQRHDDVKDKAVVDCLHRDRHLLQEGAHRSLLVRCYSCDDLQCLVRLPADDACRCGGLNALHAIGVGHDDALDILDNVAAHADLDFIRHAAKHIPRLGGGVGDSNRFGAAHGWDQLLLEDLHIRLIGPALLIHTSDSFGCSAKCPQRGIIPRLLVCIVQV